MRNIWRLSAVFVIGAVAFLFAVNKLNRPPFSSCQQDSTIDGSYKVTMDEQPSIVLTRYHINVTKDGKPLENTPVCIRVDMGGSGNMSGMGLTALATQLGPGKYELPVVFAMGGFWQGAFVIQDKASGGNAEVPVEFDVFAM